MSHRWLCLCFSAIFFDVQIRIHNAGTVKCEPEWSWNPPALSDYDLWFVWSGRGSMQTPEGKHDLSPGATFCLRPGETYAATQNRSHRLGVCYVHFDFVTATGAKTTPRDLPPRFVQLGSVSVHETILRHIVALANTNEPADRSQAELYLAAVLAGMRQATARPALVGTPREHAERIAEVTRHVREHSGELFSVEALAERAGYSVDHFSRVFAQTTGQTPREFCIAVRMDRARELLRDSAMTVEQIAAALGYADVHFFSRQFKQRIGLPPTHWRVSIARR